MLLSLFLIFHFSTLILSMHSLMVTTKARTWSSPGNDRNLSEKLMICYQMMLGERKHLLLTQPEPTKEGISVNQLTKEEIIAFIN